MVPRGNGIDPPPRVYSLNEESEYWSLLTPEEQNIAKSSQAQRSVLWLSMACQTFSECLIDARMSRLGKEWEYRTARLNRVKKVLYSSRGLGGKEGAAFRSTLHPTTKVRLVLLGASVSDADAISKETVDYLEEWRHAGQTMPPRLGEFIATEEVDLRFSPFISVAKRKLVEKQWDRETELLTRNKQLRIHKFLADELRSFPTDPPICHFHVAQGQRIRHQKPKSNSKKKSLAFSIKTIDQTKKYCQGLLDSALLLIHHAQLINSEREKEFSNSERGDFIAEQWEHMHTELTTHGIPECVEQALATVRQSNYKLGNVEAPSVHQAIEEICRQLVLKMRAVMAPIGKNQGQIWEHEWWQGHEVARHIPILLSNSTNFAKVFNRTKNQAVQAELSRESGLLLKKLLEATQVPDWIIDKFTRKQLMLMKALWNKGAVSKENIHRQIWPSKDINMETLKKLRSRTNKTNTDKKTTYEIVERKGAYSLVPE
jgi:hypothetical protein